LDVASSILSLEELADRVTELEQRLAALEEPVREKNCDAAVVGTDPERFWALGGLRSRIRDRSAVLFTGSVTLAGAPTYEWQQGADVETLLERDWTASADPLAALGHPVRLQLLREVLCGRQTSSEMGTVEGLGTTGQLYHHLRHLVAAGWLRSSGRGRYEVAPTRVIPLLVILTAAQP
jgi:Xaa-Pro aminopeptidase